MNFNIYHMLVIGLEGNIEKYDMTAVFKKFIHFIEELKRTHLK